MHKPTQINFFWLILLFRVWKWLRVIKTGPLSKALIKTSDRLETTRSLDLCIRSITAFQNTGILFRLRLGNCKLSFNSFSDWWLSQTDSYWLVTFSARFLNPSKYWTLLWRQITLLYLSEKAGAVFHLIRRTLNFNQNIVGEN